MNTHPDPYEDPDRESTYLQVLADDAVAGIMVCATDECRAALQINRMLEQGMAMVALDRRLENAPVGGVLSDNFGGTRTAVAYLILHIPNDVSLIVFDDLDWMSAYNPPLTVISQTTRQLGGLADDLLLRRIRGAAEPPQERHLPTLLIVRDLVSPRP